MSFLKDNWLKMLGGGVAGGGAMALMNRGNKNMRTPMHDQLDQTRGNFSDVINQLMQRGENAQNQPLLTAQDLYGDEMQMMGDSSRQGANATKQAISRSLMAGGGDNSGAMGANLLGVDQQLSEQLGQQSRQFAGLTNQENRFRTNRADQLINTGLQGLQGLFAMDQNRLQDELMQRQAQRDKKSNIFGNILQAGATVASAALMCWVAEELYGSDSNKFHSIRGFLMDQEKNDGELKEFVELYKEHGEQWAEEIKQDSVRRLKTEALFDELYEISQAA